MPNANKPNILLIMTDQQRYDSLGCYGTDCIDTPNLDRLASEGTVYDNCYVNNPICTPSRASLFTGKQVPQHGVYRLHDVLGDEFTLFPKHLQNLGYTTALFGKLHVSGRVQEERERHPNDGFDVYEWCMEASIGMDSPFNGYAQWLKRKDPSFFAELKQKGRALKHIPRAYHLTHWAAERTIDFLGNQTGDKPFFCMMSVFDPHNPYDDYPREYESRVHLDKLSHPSLGDNEKHHQISGLKREQEDGYLGNYHAFADEDIQRMRIGYYASLALLDDEVGQVLEKLDTCGLRESTMVIFVSDHGDMLGDHGLLVKGAYFYDACTKVPLILSHKATIPSGVRSSALVQVHDLAATILGAAGMPPNELSALMVDSLDIRGKLGKAHEIVVCAYRETGICKSGRYFDPPIHATMIFDGVYKLNVYHALSEQETPEGQLFNLASDPAEANNLWDVDYEQKSRMLALLCDWQVRMALGQAERAIPALPDQEHLIVNRLL